MRQLWLAAFTGLMAGVIGATLFLLAFNITYLQPRLAQLEAREVVVSAPSASQEDVRRLQNRLSEAERALEELEWQQFRAQQDEFLAPLLDGQ